MSEERAIRKLMAILAADVCGYSRLMGADEEGTLARLNEHRQVLVDPKIAEYRGRIVKTTGDGLLVEFASAVDALRCALAVQRGMILRNTGVAEAKRIELRIGVHVGDVITENDDIFGDGVNIAARLEAVAAPGGICVSARVQEDVQGKVEVALEDAGLQQLKNIARPVHMYRVLLGGDAASSGSAPSRSALPLPSKPSIAVLPFTNMSGDPEQEYFSDGITEDIITELSHFRELFVIARNSSFTFKGKSVHVAEVAKGLGVQYVLEGSVRKVGNRVRVTAQFVDAITANHLWADRFDRDLEDIFAVQDEVVRTIVATLAGRLEQDLRDRARRKSTSSLKAYEYLLQAREHYYKWSPRDNATARDLFEKAIAIDREYAAAYAGLAKTHYMGWVSGWTRDAADSLGRFFDNAEKSVAMDEADSRTHTALGSAHLFRREHDRARFHFERALALNASDTRVLVNMSRYEANMGNSERAVERVTQACRLNPFGNFNWYLGQACFAGQRYEGAIHALEKIRNPVAFVRSWLVASLAQAGRESEARQAARDLVSTAEAERAEAGITDAHDWLEFVAARCPFKHHADLEHMLDGLRKAGIAR